MAKHWLNKVDIVSHIWGGRLDPSGPIKNGPGGSQRAPQNSHFCPKYVEHWLKQVEDCIPHLGGMREKNAFFLFFHDFIKLWGTHSFQQVLARGGRRGRETWKSIIERFILWRLTFFNSPPETTIDHVRKSFLLTHLREIRVKYGREIDRDAETMCSQILQAGYKYRELFWMCSA